MKAISAIAKAIRYRWSKFSAHRTFVEKYVFYANWRILAIANKHGDYFRVFVVSRFRADYAQAIIGKGRRRRGGDAR